MSVIYTLSGAIQARAQIREAGLTFVFTNGHFDLLHVGHLDYLEQARRLGDVLFVGVNDDATTTTRKGADRPIVGAADRARLVAALRPVDGVILFDTETAIPLVEALRPDIYAKGGDYREKFLPERETVERWGGRVVLIDLLPGYSTTTLIARIRADK